MRTELQRNMTAAARVTMVCFRLPSQHLAVGLLFLLTFRVEITLQGPSLRRLFRTLCRILSKA